MKPGYALLVASACCLFSACSPKYYVPNTQNVPLLTKRGELNLSAAGNAKQLEVQGAFALTQRIGIMANAALFIPKSENNGNDGHGSLGEVGAGYFLPIANHFIFEAYGLVGYGGMENDMPGTVTAYPTTTGKLNANILRLALQPNIGFKSKYFHAAISSRLVSVNYSRIRGSLTYNNIDQAAYLQSNKSLFMAEPAITLRGGLQHIKLQVQLSGSYNLTEADFLQETALLSLGLNFDL
ncbi:MAG: hypothetical protein IT257_00895 [Chitinophagaceae bacterium]|nr:hypothetical protein [Chitinophagaceae bacterium]